MEDCVLDLGYIVFPNWWSVAIALIFLLLYIIANIIPAFDFLYFCLKERKFWEAPMIFFFMLIPFAGSLIGLYIMSESKIISGVALLLIYGLIICTIGSICTI